MGDGASPDAGRVGDMVLVPGNPPPAGAEIIWYQGEGGIRLRMLYAPALTASARALAVVCPGRTESIEKYFEVQRVLQAKGFAIACFDWPGQGLSDRPLKNLIRGHVTTFNTYVDGLVRGLDAIKDRAPQTRIVVAHSMGGAISLEAMRTGRLEARLAAFSAPMWGIPVSPALQRFARTVNAFGLGTFPAQPETKEEVFEGNPFTHDFERWGLYRRLVNVEPKLELGQPTIGWVVAALDVCEGFLKPGALDRVKAMPMLVCTASEEAIVDPTAAARVAALLPNARHLPVQGASHEIFMETDDRREIFWQAFDELCQQAGV
jgi:lysophospholipase